MCFHFFWFHSRQWGCWVTSTFNILRNQQLLPIATIPFHIPAAMREVSSVPLANSSYFPLCFYVVFCVHVGGQTQGLAPATSTHAHPHIHSLFFFFLVTALTVGMKLYRIVLLLFVCFFVVLGIETRAQHMQGKCWTTQPHCGFDLYFPILRMLSVFPCIY
jgi:hypothetical protein